MPYPKHLRACGAVFRNSTGTCEQVNGIIKTSRDAYWHLIPRRNEGQGSLIGNYFEDRRCLSQNLVRLSPYTAFPFAATLQKDTNRLRFCSYVAAMTMGEAPSRQAIPNIWRSASRSIPALPACLPAARLAKRSGET